MVRSANSQVPLNTDTNEEEDAAADAHPEKDLDYVIVDSSAAQPVERVVDEWEEVLVVEDRIINIIELCSDYF